MRLRAGVGVVLGLAAAVAVGLTPPRRQVVVLQPLGTLDAALVEVVRADVADFFDVEVKVAPGMPLPSSAWYEPRQRYRADRLLEALAGVAPEADRVVGITTSDISVTKGTHPDWGIFGLASLGGRTCVVSTFRLRRGPASRELLLERLRKVVRHELGHTWGLEHCPTPHCLMQDCEGTVRTVDGEPGLLCARCREALRRLGLAAGPAALAGER
ncbi:MAG: hypothetical protein AB2L07_05675 [Thermoanaerobaculaceae bacterium]